VPQCCKLGKEIGDAVEAELSGISKTYLITGFSQSISNMGMSAYLTVSGMELLTPIYSGIWINISLQGNDVLAFIPSFRAQYGQLAFEVIDVASSIEAQSTMYSSAVL